MSNFVIEVNNVSKHYAPISYQPSLRHEGKMLFNRLLRKETKTDWEQNVFWALKNINFNISPGEAVAIVGRNGAGKTTLLRLLSGITDATTGTIHVRGRFVSLIGLGAGFDVERSGRENIYLNAAIYGLSPDEVNVLVDDIIEFSELGDFLQKPVKQYSSGMVARLGFSIAIHILPDIVLLDEILAVGDAAFQEKCMERIHALKDENRTLLFVSHSASTVREMCERTILLHKGEMVMDGKTDEVLEKFNQIMGIE